MSDHFRIMVKKLLVIKTDDTTPYHNLALEETLLETVKEHECILYLWQNRQTVVIGRNQNALAECRIQRLENDGGFLARRLSGGGAVYHDTGNLNFTFIACAEDFDKEKQTDVILNAVKAVGIDAEKNGRNDLTADGRKFSGHAYYKTREKCYHHGTLMLYVDKSKLSDYLNVSEMKLKSKGVASVKSRVVNLCEMKPDLTVAALQGKLIEAFSEVYDLPVEFIDETQVDTEKLSELQKKYASPEWKYMGEEILKNSVEKRFSWGQARADFEIENGKFSKIQFYSDGLDAEYLSEIAERLTACPAKKGDMLAHLTAGTDSRGWDTQAIKSTAEDIAVMISEYISEVAK